MKRESEIFCYHFMWFGKTGKRFEDIYLDFRWVRGTLEQQCFTPRLDERNGSGTLVTCEYIYISHMPHLLIYYTFI